MSSKSEAFTTTQELLDDSRAAQDDVVDLEFQGSFATQIVGVQYYHGTITPHEMVLLHREPDNPYDANAVRVDNIHGIQVGHIPRVVMEHLAPWIDRKQVVLEATVHYVHGKYKIPVDIDVYCDPSIRESFSQALRRAGLTLSSASITAAAISPPPRSPPYHQPHYQRSPPSYRPPPPPPPPAPRSTRLTAQQVSERISSAFDEMVKRDGPREEAEPNTAIITTPLYPHQKEALKWMLDQEAGQGLPVFWEEDSEKGGYVHTLCNHTTQEKPKAMRGGMLADAMGLGKTLTVMALIAADKDVAVVAADEALKKMKQEEEEDKEFDDEDLAPKKKKQKKTQKQQRGGKNPKNASAQVASASAPSPTKPTLIICPLSVMSGWAMQFEQHARPGTLSVLTYHGTDRDRRSTFIGSHDVVISTYSTLSSESDIKNGLMGVKWYRVVCDEAHTIKNPNTLMAKTLGKLKLVEDGRRWGLTGTPIQNSLQDLYGLISFLKLDPIGTDLSLYRRVIERPFLMGQEDSVKRLQTLVGAVSLRRTKDTTRDGRPILSLPSRDMYVVDVDMDETSRAKYLRWEAAGRALVARHLAAGTLMANYTAVLEVILRLRQICCDESLVGHEPVFSSAALAALVDNQSADGAGTAALPSTALSPEKIAALRGLLKNVGEEPECPVCLYEIEQVCITACCHVFCVRCIHNVISRDKAKCPLCRAPISHNDIVEPEPEPEPTEEGRGGGEKEKGGVGGGTDKGCCVANGAKVKAIMATLRHELAVHADECHVVFSQFTSMLDILGRLLETEGLAYVRLDGKTPARERETILRQFNASNGATAAEDADVPRVFLVSLKAGGVGLNLTRASHAHIAEPFWNPAVEDQAADRVHRLGQQRNVKIHRYIMKGSIEERMVELQEEKKKLMKAAFDRSVAQNLREARIRHIRILMQLNDAV